MAARLHRAAGCTLQRWQTEFLPVYGLWAAVVVAAFPPMVDFA